jgi:hypothetical protein
VQINAAWADVIDVGIRLPTSTLAQRRAVDLANWWLGTMGAPRTIEVSISLKRRNHALDLGRTSRYRWQLQVVLNDLLDVLQSSGDFSALGRPEVMREVERLSHRVPGVARLFMYTDLLGLERFLGARGAYRSQLERIIVRQR